jgi:hypothetical protein
MRVRRNHQKCDSTALSATIIMLFGSRAGWLRAGENARTLLIIIAHQAAFSS